MPLSPYVQLMNFITKHAVIATFTMLAALTAFSASAAQILAPDNLKPSTIVENIVRPSTFVENIIRPKIDNQVVDIPSNALRPDGQNNVASLDQCNLSIKYPSYFSFENKSLPVTIQYLPNYNDQFESGATLVAPEKNGASQIHYFSFGCYKLDANLESGPQTQFSTELISKDELGQKFGWFITQADIQDIRGMKFDNNIEKSTNYRGYNQITFKYKDRQYFVNFQERSPTKAEYDQDINLYNEDSWKLPGIFANQVNLQFNSTVKNSANVAIEPALSNSSKSTVNQSSISSSISSKMSLESAKAPLLLVSSSGSQNYEPTSLLLDQTGSQIDLGLSLVENKQTGPQSSSGQLLPIQVGDIIYIPYPSGNIVALNSKTKQYRVDTFDFTIADMSLFNGNYYLKEYDKDCDLGFKIEQCRIKFWEINREDISKKRVILNKVGLENYAYSKFELTYADQNNFWLKNAFSEGGRGFEKYTKYNLKTSEFIEGYNLQFEFGIPTLVTFFDLRGENQGGFDTNQETAKTLYTLEVDESCNENSTEINRTECSKFFDNINKYLISLLKFAPYEPEPASAQKCGDWESRSNQGSGAQLFFKGELSVITNKLNLVASPDSIICIQ